MLSRGVGLLQHLVPGGEHDLSWLQVGCRLARQSQPCHWHMVDTGTSVVDPNTLNFDPDPGFWLNLDPDPDPGLYYQF